MMSILDHRGVPGTNWKGEPAFDFELSSPSYPSFNAWLLGITYDSFSIEADPSGTRQQVCLSQAGTFKAEIKLPKEPSQRSAVLHAVEHNMSYGLRSDA